MSRLPKIDILCGDSLLILPTLPADSFDSCVTDPPYELAFMGKRWDSTGIAYNVDLWREVLRVLKPGAHLLAFGGTRTQHRMVCAIEDAGFEIRDQIDWLYSQGFPKSLDVSKAIDRRRTDDIRPVCRFLWAAIEATTTVKALAAHFDFHPRMVEHWAARDTDSQPAVPTWEQWLELKRLLAFGDEMDAEVWRLNGRKGKPGDAWYEREVLGHNNRPAGWFTSGDGHDITAPATPAAQRWQGWGTALKPSHEPIVLARKPLSEPTVAANVLRWGTGGLNVDGCRVAGDKGARTNVPFGAWREMEGRDDRQRPAQTYDPTQGRWPPNTLFSHLPECGEGDAGDCADGCAVAELGRQSGVSKSPAPYVRSVDASEHPTGRLGIRAPEGSTATGHGDTGTAARFFPCFRYEAKASRKDRGEGNTHPTVKPTELMCWLVKLVTPPAGVVLDPFAGSGTTLVACRREGFDCVGVEMEQGHCEIARGRLA